MPGTRSSKTNTKKKNSSKKCLKDNNIKSSSNHNNNNDNSTSSSDLKNKIKKSTISSNIINRKGNNNNVEVEEEGVSYIPQLDKNEDILGFVTTASKCIRSTFDMLTSLYHRGSISFFKDKVVFGCSTNCIVVNAEIDAYSCDVEDHIFNYNKVKEIDYKILTAATHKFSMEIEEQLRTSKYKPENMVMIHVALPILNQCMSAITHADIFCLRMTEESYKKNELIIEIHHRKNRYVHKFNVPIQHNRDESVKRQLLRHIALGENKKFDIGLHMSTQEFLQTLRTAKKSGTSLQILAGECDDKKNWCHFCTPGMGVGVDVISSHRFRVEEKMSTTTYDSNVAKKNMVKIMDQNNRERIKSLSQTPTLKIYCNTESCYSTPLLMALAKTSSMSRVVSIFCNNKKDVIGLKHRIGVIGNLTCMMAPLDDLGIFEFVEKIKGSGKYYILKKTKIDSASSSSNAIDGETEDIQNKNINMAIKCANEFI